MTQIKRETIGEHLFDHQLEMMGRIRTEIFDNDRWRFQYTLTRNQYTDFRDYAIKLIMKTFKCNKNKAIGIFEWYWEIFGVRLKG